MPEYKSPGVYVEEIPGTPPIAPVGTSTVGFVGEVDDTATNPNGSPFAMPFKSGSTTEQYVLVDVDKPQVITNFDQFKNKFGDFQTGNSTLAHAVYGFFQNGGTRCYVVRTADLTDAPGVAASLKTFEPIDEIAIVVAPGALTQDVQEEVISHCEIMTDRFAIIDGQRVQTIDTPSIKGGVSDSNYAALYFPWIQVSDPVTKDDPITKGRIFVPPSGHVAGIYSRVDQSRGVHKAPGNETVRGALGLEYLVSKNEQDGVNLDGINIIRSFKGNNIKVWGARTLGTNNGEFTYINVRRVMNFLVESIDEGTQFVVFEPNSRKLWQKIIRSVSAFLTVVWRDGALFGDTVQEAFYVKCDDGTNPPEVRDLGQVVTEIGVAIVRPAEFVIFKISQVTLPAA